MNLKHRLLLDYYNQKLQEELQRLWADGTLDQKRLDELKGEHFRTPYQNQ